MNRIQDFSLKCMKVIRRQHEIIKKLSSINTTAVNSPEQTLKFDKGISNSITTLRSTCVMHAQHHSENTDMKIGDNLYKELTKKLKIIISSKDKELKSTRNTVESCLCKIEQLENYISVLKEESRRTVLLRERKNDGSIYSSENEDAYCMKSVPFSSKRYHDKSNIDSKLNIIKNVKISK